MKVHCLNLLVFLLIIALLFACKDQAFTKTKNADSEINSLNGSSNLRIKSYSLSYNPKSNGLIKLELENGAEYKAKSVDGGSFSSINSLLNQPEVLFDTIRKEVIINKSIQN